MTIVESSRILTTSSNFERSGIELAAIHPCIISTIIIKFCQTADSDRTTSNIIESGVCIQSHRCTFHCAEVINLTIGVSQSNNTSSLYFILIIQDSTVLYMEISGFNGTTFIQYSIAVLEINIRTFNRTTCTHIKSSIIFSECKGIITCFLCWGWIYTSRPIRLHTLSNVKCSIGSQVNGKSFAYLS